MQAGAAGGGGGGGARGGAAKKYALETPTKNNDRSHVYLPRPRSHFSFTQLSYSSFISHALENQKSSSTNPLHHVVHHPLQDRRPR